MLTIAQFMAIEDTLAVVLQVFRTQEALQSYFASKPKLAHWAEYLPFEHNKIEWAQVLQVFLYKQRNERGESALYLLLLSLVGDCMGRNDLGMKLMLLVEDIHEASEGLRLHHFERSSLKKQLTMRLSLWTHLMATLTRCRIADSLQALRGIFVDSRLSSYRARCINRVEHLGAVDRLLETVSELLSLYNPKSREMHPLQALLSAIRATYPTGDALYHEFYALEYWLLERIFQKEDIRFDCALMQSHMENFYLKSWDHLK